MAGHLSVFVVASLMTSVLFWITLGAGAGYLTRRLA